MPNYSLNTGLPEKSRQLDDYGFNGILNSKAPATAYRYNDETSAPLEKTHPLTNEVNPSSDTTTMRWPEAAGDIMKRKANG